MMSDDWDKILEMKWITASIREHFRFLLDTEGLKSWTWWRIESHRIKTKAPCCSVSHPLFLLIVASPTSPSQDSLPGPDAGPADHLLHHLHPRLCPAQPPAKEGGEEWRPRRSGQWRDGAGGTQEGGVCGFQLRTVTTHLRHQHRQGDAAVTVVWKEKKRSNLPRLRHTHTHTYLA